MPWECIIANMLQLYRIIKLLTTWALTKGNLCELICHIFLMIKSVQCASFIIVILRENHQNLPIIGMVLFLKLLSFLFSLLTLDDLWILISNSIFIIYRQILLKCSVIIVNNMQYFEGQSLELWQDVENFGCRNLPSCAWLDHAFFDILNFFKGIFYLLYALFPLFFTLLMLFRCENALGDLVLGFNIELERICNLAAIMVDFVLSGKWCWYYNHLWLFCFLLCLLWVVFIFIW